MSIAARIERTQVVSPRAGVGRTLSRHLAALAVLTALLSAPAATAAQISTDTRPLAAQSGGTFNAPRLDPALRRAAAAANASGAFSRLPAGARVTLSVEHVMFGSNIGSSSSSGGSSQMSDFISGRAILKDARGVTLRSVPITANVASSYAGVWYSPDTALRRYDVLAEVFVSWSARALN